MIARVADAIRIEGRTHCAQMPRSRSITRRLTLALGAISLAIFLATGVLLDRALMAEIEKQELAEAAGRLTMMRHFIHSRPERLGPLRQELDDMLESHPELRVWVIARSGESIYGGATPVVVQEGGALLRLTSGERRFKGIREPLQLAGFEGATLLVGVDAAARERLMVEHRVTLILVTLLGTASIVVLTAWATARGLAPVAALSQAAARIRPDALGVRLPLAGTARELSELVEAFNRVLDRLEQAYRQLDAFNADVAHELRTPLATMIGGTQVTLASPRSADELREMLLSNLEELEALNRVVNDMLFLARADRGERPDAMAPVSLAADAQAVVDYFDAAAHEVDISLTVRGEATAVGNAPLIRRAISNLVSNALRYSARGTTVEILIGASGTDTSVSVRNPGAPIEPAELARIFDRFFRARRGAGGQEGHGLGLSIVRAIARMHGGDTFATSEKGFTEIGFRLRSVPPARLKGGAKPREEPTIARR